MPRRVQLDSAYWAALSRHMQLSSATKTNHSGDLPKNCNGTVAKRRALPAPPIYPLSPKGTLSSHLPLIPKGDPEFPYLIPKEGPEFPTSPSPQRPEEPIERLAPEGLVTPNSNSHYQPGSERAATRARKFDWSV